MKILQSIEKLFRNLNLRDKANIKKTLKVNKFQNFEILLFPYSAA